MIKNSLKIFGLALFSILFLGQTNVFAHPAWGIVVDSKKQIYFTDLETVWKIDREGKVSTFREGVSGRHVHNLAIDPQDNIYGIDNTYNPQRETYPRGIWKMSAKGEFSYIVSMTDNLPQGWSIWRDNYGNTYSTEPYNNERKESKIIKRAPDGKTSLFAGGKFGYADGKKEDAKFSVIIDIAFGKDDAIYLSGDDKIRKIDKLGNVTTLYSYGQQSKNQKKPNAASQFFGVDVDEQNNVLAADFSNRRLLRISYDGKISEVFNSEKDWSPIGVAASNNEIYVLEVRPYSSAIHTGNRVWKIAADGKASLVINLEEAIKSKSSSVAGEQISLSESERNFDSSSALENKRNESENKKIGFYGIVGATLVAFAAFIIFKKFKFIN